MTSLEELLNLISYLLDGMFNEYFGETGTVEELHYLTYEDIGGTEYYLTYLGLENGITLTEYSLDHESNEARVLRNV